MYESDHIVCGSFASPPGKTVLSGGCGRPLELGITVFHLDLVGLQWKKQWLQNGCKKRTQGGTNGVEWMVEGKEDMGWVNLGCLCGWDNAVFELDDWR